MGAPRNAPRRFKMGRNALGGAALKTSEHLVLGNVYTRAELAIKFDIKDATLNNGIFKPKQHDSVWLFITEEKTADRTQYRDILKGDVLQMDGQTQGRTDPFLIDHAARGLELVLFYRQSKKEHPGAGFAYQGVFNYEGHVGSAPARFTLRRAADGEATVTASDTTGIEPATLDASSPDDAIAIPVLDAEALTFIEGFRDPNTWFVTRWMPKYRRAIETIAQALAEDRPQDIFEFCWKEKDNAISNAGKGQLKYDVVDGMRGDLTQVIRDIHADGSPTKFAKIVERFEGWKTEGRISIVPRLLIARTFSGVHPQHYHTTVDVDSHNRVLEWFVEHTGFRIPRPTNWAERATALAKHLDRTGIFNDPLERNIFPWFVIEQLRARFAPDSIRPGHAPRPTTTIMQLPPARRNIELRHNRVQTALFARLVSEFGENKVWTEFPTGTGGYADAIARQADGGCHLYEIKIASTASEVVRQAMGQLLEYGFRIGGLEPVKLFVVGEPVLDDVTLRFLRRLRSEFNMMIEYLQVELADETES